MKKSLLAGLLLVPASVFALDYSDVSGRYEDQESFSQAERAAINVLTNLGAVEGNPDGTFRSSRTLNRAEFVKIALGIEGMIIEEGEGPSCFPDVLSSDWFSGPVCYAKGQSLIMGYADGYFRPANPVTAAEAVMILGRAFSYPTLPGEGDEWFERAWRSAEEHGVLFDAMPSPHTPLTRGQMARLAAAFRAEADGELDLYRAAERGETVTSSSSEESASSASTSSVSSVSSTSSAAASSSATSVAVMPAKSRIVLIDGMIPAFADATFVQADQDVNVREVRIKLEKKITSFYELYLVDATGKELMPLRLDLTDTSREKWYANIPLDTAPRMTQGAPTTFGVTAKLRPWGTGGVSGELIQADTFTLIVQSLDASSSWQLQPTTENFPKTQTAQTILSEIGNGGEAAGTLPAGTNAVIGLFSFSGSIVPGASVLNVEQLVFTAAAAGTSIANPKVGLVGGGVNPCSLSANVITCNPLPEGIQDASKGLTLEVRADVTRLAGEGPHTLQLSIEDPGTVDQPGAVQWFDGTTHFRWVQTSGPVAKSTVWTVVNP